MDLDSLRLLQTQILQRLSELEACMLPSGQQQHSNISPTLYQQGKAEEDEEDNENIHHCTTMESRISHILRSGGVGDFEFKRVPSDYYERSLEERRYIVGAPSIDHLCKSIVLTNTQAHASVTDCSDPKNSKYYVVVIQYTARLNAENVKNFLHTLNNGKIPKKKFNLRLAPEEESSKLTGYEHNAVTPIGMKTDIPVILDQAITRLQRDFFWLGGGEVDLKLGINTSQFINFIKPFLVNCS